MQKPGKAHETPVPWIGDDAEAGNAEPRQVETQFKVEGAEDNIDILQLEGIVVVQLQVAARQMHADGIACGEGAEVCAIGLREAEVLLHFVEQLLKGFGGCCDRNMAHGATVMEMNTFN